MVIVGLILFVVSVFQLVTPDMRKFLDNLKTRVRVGVVGGSDLRKIKEQLGDDGEMQTCGSVVFQ